MLGKGEDILMRTMGLSSRTGWLIFLGILALLPLAAGAASKGSNAARGIATTSFTISLDAQRKTHYSAVLKSRQGAPLYEVRLEPDFAVGNKLVTWTLELYRITPEGVETKNLLAPIPKWHGLQAFHFNALDLTRPADKGFGRVRIFRQRDLTLVAVVEAFELVPTADAFSKLTLYMEVK